VERALRTRSEGIDGAGTATPVAQPAQAIRHSVFSPLLFVDNAVCGSAGPVPNAADGIDPETVFMVNYYRYDEQMQRQSCII